MIEHRPDSYLTLGASARAENRVQRSRFLALVTAVTDEESARAAISREARRCHDARHVCYAWRLGPGPEFSEHRNDAGEPAGTAGEPILAALRRRGLSDCLGIVVRYFGGVKLGTGGLARAYGEAATAAVAAAPERVILLGQEFDLSLPYALQKTLRHLLAGRQGRVANETYGTDVAWRVWLPHSRCAGFVDAVTEATAGQVVPAPGADVPRNGSSQ